MCLFADLIMPAHESLWCIYISKSYYAFPETFV